MTDLTRLRTLIADGMVLHASYARALWLAVVDVIAGREGAV